MKRHLVFGMALCLAWAAGRPASGQALGTAFTYQGRLTDSGAPANGSYDLRFKLFDAATAGSQVGSNVTRTSVSVASGLFTVSLDFGTVFAGSKRFLEIGVRPGGTSGAFTFLSPRQELTPAPSALYAPQAGDAVTLGGVAANSYQTRVSATCPAGSTIGQINSDGTVVCQTNTAQPAFALTRVDSPGKVDGTHTSITIGTDGLGLISYHDALTAIGNGVLKAAQCSNTACTSVTTATLDSAGDVGFYTSITIGTDSLGLISYYDQTNGDLKVAHCSNTACSAATTATLDSAGDVGQYTSITIGTDGLGVISYYDATNADLKTAHCLNVACTIASTSTLDSTGDVGQYTSITIGTDGLGLISYYQFGGFGATLKVAHCSNTPCSTTFSINVDGIGFFRKHTSITTGTDGLGLVSYYDSLNGDLKVAHCDDILCASAVAFTIDQPGDVGQYSSIAIGTDGLGLISYWDATNLDLKVAHCSNTACSAATTATLDSTGGVGEYSSITMGTDGFGLISYWDATNNDLKVAHCSNTPCIPNLRRR